MDVPDPKLRRPQSGSTSGPIAETLSLKIPCGADRSLYGWSDLFDKKIQRDSALKAVRAKPGQPDIVVELRVAGRTYFKQKLPWVFEKPPKKPVEEFTDEELKRYGPIPIARLDTVEFRCEQPMEIEIEMMSMHMTEGA